MAKVIKRIRDAGYTSGIINMKTGRGKTHIMSEIASRLPGKVLILCHNETNCRSTLDHFVRFYGLKNEGIGQVYSGNKRITDLTIATHKIFGLHPEYFTDFEVILYDEMHKNISEIMIRALCKMQKCTALY
jgi:superfamily II DNA or RNA helicase